VDRSVGDRLDDERWHSLTEAVNELKREFFPELALEQAGIKSAYIRRWNLPDKPWPPNPFARLSADRVAEFSERL
jgi:hypothetical protein